ncbi:hypothetical protein HgNV_055 [Homarus gammarus nudivirus]|uniref:Uncharacterized protein n=1 Tax=Homarus gammarus nudivirus TaxID=2509616 RepID=A0A411HB69_9VIRU|nr:hypothetical protein KM727_gp55 [Homarus gammarus nudivirus]QBB28660.1 hypothetical protein HgNV_055 [Homarus gammarus nudivirus]
MSTESTVIDMSTHTHKSGVYVVGAQSGLLDKMSIYSELELEYGEYFSIKLVNNTAKRMVASIVIDNKSAGYHIVEQDTIATVVGSSASIERFQFRPTINDTLELYVLIEYEDPWPYNGQVRYVSKRTNNAFSFPILTSICDQYKYTIIANNHN